MSAERADTVSVGWVLLTMGDRPAELRRAVESLLAHEPPPAQVVVVANGCDAAALDLPPGATVVDAGANVGIPAGRNLGAHAVEADVIAFLDDDADAADPAITGYLAAQFAADPRLGVIAFRIVDPETGQTQSRHVPAVGGRHPERARPVTTFLGGAAAVRRTAFHEAGELPGAFFYAHEETDLSWQLLDRGFGLRYDPAVTVTHPATTPGRHAMSSRLGARNRVWLARRNLPWVLAIFYTSVWTALPLLRRNVDPRAFLAGTVEGWRTDPGPRRPIAWRTVKEMTRLGRPPIV